MSNLILPNIYHVGVISSTMDAARAMLADACGAPFAVLAEAQSKGRGTTGRTWMSPKGNMYLTICVSEDMIRPHICSVVPLITGLACRAAIMELAGGTEVHLKWPNDIIFDSRKIGGSIVENEGSNLLIGIGVNVEVAPPVTDEGRASATVNEVAAVRGLAAVAPSQLAAAVWRHLFAALADEELSREAVVRDFEASMDKSLTLHRRTAAGRDPEPLRALRLNEWGHLVVLRPSGEEKTLIAEYLF